jgi:hypothetical protein
MLLNAPGYLFSVPGLVLALLGVSMMTIAHTGVSFGGVTLGVNSMIAGSLCTILGIQVGTLGVFATVASDPIQKPGDVVTSWVSEHATLESGATAGLVVFTAGAAYATWLVVNWVLSGFGAVPFTTSGLLAFTSIVIGVQLVFSSFLFSAVR